MHVYFCICTSAHIHTYIHTYIYIYIYTYMFIQKHTCLHTCTYIYIYICMYISLCTHTCMHTYIPTYIHACVMSVCVCVCVCVDGSKRHPINLHQFLSSFALCALVDRFLPHPSSRCRSLPSSLPPKLISPAPSLHGTNHDVLAAAEVFQVRRPVSFISKSHLLRAICDGRLGQVERLFPKLHLGASLRDVATFIVALEKCRCAPLLFMLVCWLVVHGEES